MCRRLCLLDLAALNSDYVHYLIAAQMSEHDEGGRGGCGSRTDGAHEIGSGYNPLDSFFPFDPYLLQASSKYITPLYVNWSDVVGDEEESEEEKKETKSVAEGEKKHRHRSHRHREEKESAKEDSVKDDASVKERKHRHHHH